MELILRDFEPSDAPQIIEVYRDATQSLRKSNGGSHPDDYIEKLITAPDEEILRQLIYSDELILAEVRGTGEIAGMGGLTNRLKNRILGSTYSCNHYVKRKFQGVGVGSLLKKATLERANKLGFRKMYGYSTEEAINFNKKHGAVFYPQFNAFREGSEVLVHYYEVELRKSVLNRLRIEPYTSELSIMSGLLRKVKNGR
jgi:GNAT superfamily N-acetyltransferase